MEREIEIDGLSVNILRVPYFSQGPVEWLCIIYSLKMVFDFYKNIHSNEHIRKAAPLVDRDEIIKITNTRIYTGTTVSEDLMIRLRKAFPTMNFELKEINYKEIREELAKMHPVIVLYNPSYFLNNERGPSHAGVVIGMTNDYIILNNPWFGPIFCVDKTKFESCWELEYNWAIIIKPKQNRRLSNKNA